MMRSGAADTRCGCGRLVSEVILSLMREEGVGLQMDLDLRKRAEEIVGLVGLEVVEWMRIWIAGDERA